MTDLLLRDDCPAESALHDLADGVLGVEEANGVRTHLAHCARCEAMLARLLALRARARALPRELPPPAALWDGVHARLAGTGGSTSAPRQRWWRRPSMLAAAALLLMEGLDR